MIRHFVRQQWVVLLLAAMPLAGLAEAPLTLAQLDTITVLGTRTAKSPDAVPRSIDVIDQAQVTRQQNVDLGAVVDELPNVSLAGGPRAVGETIRIRGLTSQRILLLIDGVEQSYSVGHLSGGFVSPGMIESVEVERGPASVLWGSGAIGGVVAVDTKDAADLLAQGQDFGARVHGGYASASAGWVNSASLYGHLSENIDGLVWIGRRSNENLQLGDNRRLPNSAYQRRSLLAKSTVHFAPGNSLRVSHRRSRLEGVSPNNPRQNQGSLEEREIVVGSTLMEWNLLPASSKWIDLTAHLSHIRTEVDENQVGVSEREDTEVSVYGVDVSNTSRFDLGGAGRHVLTYGLDVTRGEIESTQNGQPRVLVPSGERLTAGLFAQDEIHWNQAWTTSFGLRYDHYRSEAASDSALEHDDSALSLQAGLMWQATDWLQLYASYAEAFRAPSIAELFSNGPHRIRGFVLFNLQPNPDLEPEQAANKEVGLRTQWNGLFKDSDRARFELTFFRNDVENFIQDVCVANCRSFRPGPPVPTLTFRNITEARLQGFEASASYATEAWFAGMNYGQVRGHNETRDQPLAGIPADTWMVRTGLTALPWDGRMALRMTHAEEQHHISPAANLPEPADSYTVVDLLTSWRPTSNLRLHLAVGNIADAEYRRAGAYISEAGRNLKLGLTLTF